VLKSSVPAPTPVLKLAAPLLRSDKKPNAELNWPVVRLPRALCPSAVLPPGKAVSGAAGSTACAPGINPKQTSADRTVVNIIFLFFIT